MRVVFVTHNYPRHADDVAGSFLHPLARALRERGVDVRVVAPSDRGKSGVSDLDGVPVRRVRYSKPEHETLAYSGAMMSALRTPRGMVSLRSMIGALRSGAQQEVDGSKAAVVHAHWWVPAGMAAPRRTPLVITCHGSDVRLLARGGPLCWVGRRTLARAAVVTTVSAPFAATITECTGIPIAPDAVQPMPVLSVPRPRTTGGGGIVVIGRMTPQKRIGLAIWAYSLLRSQGSRAACTIVGDGPLRSELVALVTDLGLSRDVRFVGAVAPARVPDFLATADCCVMVAQDEGFGLVAVEALMQGVPVVACSDGGGLLDIVNSPDAGTIVAPDPVAIAGAVHAILADRTASSAAHALGTEWKARLAPDTVADRAMAWYAQALRG